METDHFIILDRLNTVSGNEFDRSCPQVQIVYPLNQNSYPDKKDTESYPENGLTYSERRKYLYTITLNVDSGL